MVITTHPLLFPTLEAEFDHVTALNCFIQFYLKENEKYKIWTYHTQGLTLTKALQCLRFAFVCLLLQSLSKAATLFLTDRVGPGRFIICDLS